VADSLPETTATTPAGGGAASTSAPADTTATETTPADTTTDPTATDTTAAETTPTDTTDTTPTAAEDAAAAERRRRRAAAQRRREAAARRRAAAARTTVTVRVDASTRPTFLCVDDGSGRILFSGVLSGKKVFKERRVRMNVGLASTRVTVNGNPVTLSGSPAGLDITRSSGARQLPLGQRPCG
jgi:hypothetical protein